MASIEALHAMDNAEGQNEEHGEHPQGVDPGSRVRVRPGVRVWDAGWRLGLRLGSGLRYRRQKTEDPQGDVPGFTQRLASLNLPTRA